MSFKKNKYTVIKNAISKDLATFLANYFVIRKQVYDTCMKAKYISPFENAFGGYEKGNQQVPHTYAHYSDVAFETLMLKLQPKMEQITGLKLSPNYTFSRLYKRGDILERHKDRFSCEISTTLNLGGDSWPIYIEPNPKKGKEINGKYVSNMTKGIKIILKPGDMLVYRGDKLEHWREPFQGEICGQVFLHYNNIKTKEYEKNLFDKRPHLGLPVWFKKEV